jgi:hypothetical protein
MKCENPNKHFTIINGARHHFRYPCGKCANCRKVRQQQWKLRLMLESFEHKYNTFVTFTYNDLHLPDEVTKDDAQKLIKRLRKAWHKRTDGKGKFRYYIVKEFGSRTGRQHFHAIIFGIPFTEQQVFETAWRKNTGTSFKPRYVSLGYIHSRELTPARIGYCVKYSTKFLESNGGSITDGTPEFALMSRGRRKDGTRGIGLNGLSRIINSVKNAWKSAKTDECLSEYFDANVGSMRSGNSRMSIDPYLKKLVYETIRNEERDELTWEDDEFMDILVTDDRKKELRRAMRRSRNIPITLLANQAELDERNKAKKVAERKQRVEKKKIKL